MSIIANNVVAKLSVAFVTVAMLFTMITPAQAQSEEEMQDMINDLLAQIAALKGTTSVSSSVCPFTWTRSLSNGSTGADVMKLQQFLNADPETRVAAAGAGSVGMETQTYGPLTAAAVSKFQVKYRADILTPSGLVNPTGYFGPSSMAKANALCVSGGSTGGNDDDDDDDTDSSDLEGEASLGDVELNDGEDTDIEEGQEAAPVAELEVEFEDGDAIVDRIDVTLVGSGDEQDPWDTFEEVSLWVDGDEVASMAADDEDEYLDEDDGSLRFTDLDLVVREDEATTIVIAVTVQSSVDGADDGEAWDIDATEIRFTDADDVTSTEDINVTPVDFDINQEGEGDELAVKTSAEDPDATTLQLKDDERSDWMTFFAFDLDTDDSDNDIEVNSIPVTITISSTTAGVGQVVNDLQLVIDGEVYDDWATTTGTFATDDVVVVTFDIDGDLVIDAGDRVTVELQAEFKQLSDANLVGTTIQGSVTGANANAIDAEGADDLDNSNPDQLTGQATGEAHTLRTEGVILELVSSTENLKENSDTTTVDDEGVFVLKFDVTAFDSDLYIDDTAASSSASSGTEGVHFLVYKDNAQAGAASSTDAALTSTASLTGGRYLVAEGETETFTLTVEVDPIVSGFHKVVLYSVNYKADGTNGAPDTYQRALPQEDFESEALSI